MGQKKDEEDAHKYRLARAETMLKLFEEAHSHPVTVEELENWVASPEGQEALAYYRQPDGKARPE
jgi:hypothetical protein